MSFFQFSSSPQLDEGISIPALFMRTATSPVSKALSAKAFTWASSETSVGTPITVVSSDATERTSSTAASSRGPGRSASTTPSPRSANRRAATLPTPLAAPVTTAKPPSSRASLNIVIRLMTGSSNMEGDLFLSPHLYELETLRVHCSSGRRHLPAG